MDIPDQSRTIYSDLDKQNENVISQLSENIPSFDSFSEALSQVSQHVHVPPIISTVLSRYAHQSIHQLPTWLQPLAHILVNKAHHLTDTAYYLAVQKELAKANSAAQSQQTTPSQKILAPIQPADSGETFQGFAEYAHIGVFGATGAGKTTLITTLLLKSNTFYEFDTFVYCGLETGEEGVSNLRKASEYNRQVIHSKPSSDSSFMLFKTMDFALMESEVSNKQKGASKLVFIDDAQGDATKTGMRRAASFLKVAKHKQCTVIFSLHHAAGEDEKQIRGSCSYFILCNLGQDQFNRYAGGGSSLLKGNDLWLKYSSISDIHKRVIIVDVHKNKRYYATKNLQDFDPLVNKNPNEKINESSKQIYSTQNN